MNTVGTDKQVDVYLINPPVYRSRDNVWRALDTTMPPTGLGILAAVARREAGARVRLLDAAALRLDLDGVRERLRDVRPGLVGITATTLTVRAALAIARAAKEEHPGATVVLGGVHPTVAPDEVLAEPAVDLVVRGEGEHTLSDLLAGRDRADIAGLSYRRDGNVIHNPDRQRLPDLDALPLPAYDLLPVRLYRPSPGGYRRLPSLSLLAGRGCPGVCSFCCKAVHGDRVRYRSPGHILNEVRLLRREYGVRDFVFYDDTLTADRDKVLELCRALGEVRGGVSWSCMSRVDCVDGELLRAMRRSGCHQVCYGVESADAQVRRRLRKAISLDRVRRAVDLSRRAGLNVRLSFMLGSPGETEDSLRRTVELALELDPTFVQFNITVPYPGTEMFAWAEREGCLASRNWDDYDLSRPVMNLPTVDADTVLAWYREGYRRFYRRPVYILRRLWGLRSPAELRAALRVVPRLWRFTGRGPTIRKGGDGGNARVVHQPRAQG